jgi:predicted aminopeptidase
MKHAGFIAAMLAGALLLGAVSCTEVGYYAQCVEGHVGLLARRQPIEAVLADPATAAEVKGKLATVLRIRDFASSGLALPENGSYRCYADLGRPEVVWNVVAAPEFSLAPKTWCFPVAGCVSYRGYYDEAAARRMGARLQAQGYDVHVYGVSAYSTLGWFDDPVLNTFLDRSDAGLAALVFHELAHQRLYLKDDSAFSEAFATAVEEEGVARWLRREGREAELDGWRQAKEREGEFAALLLEARRRLEALYASPGDDAARRAGKARVFAELRQAYGALRERWGGYAGYDRWFERPLNNARLASVATYRDRVPAFAALLTREGGDLERFYARAAELGRLPAAERQTRFSALAGGETQSRVAAEIARLWPAASPSPRPL